MERLEHYRQLIQDMLTQYVAELPPKEGIESQLLIDTQRDHYQWMRVGWKGSQRVYHIVVHLDIKDGKVWIQQNTTDSNLTQALLMRGVAHEDIVLGLQPAYKRELASALT
jgi:hypothetical protein